MNKIINTYFNDDKNNNFEIAKLLLEQKDIDINVVCYEKCTNKIKEKTTEMIDTAISSAILSGAEEILKILLSKKDVDISTQLFENTISNKEVIYQETYCQMMNVKEKKKNIHIYC